jgi:hypothetical protein
VKYENEISSLTDRMEAHHVLTSTYLRDQTLEVCGVFFEENFHRYAVVEKVSTADIFANRFVAHG